MAVTLSSLYAQIYKIASEHNLLSYQINNLLSYINYPQTSPCTANKKMHQLLTLPTKTKIHRIKKLLAANVPVEYITGYTHFINLPICVGMYETYKTYVPSPFTENVVWLAIAYFLILAHLNHATTNILFLDIGTGSGAILLSIYQFFLDLLHSKNKYETEYKSTLRDVISRLLQRRPFNTLRDRLNASLLSYTRILHSLKRKKISFIGTDISDDAIKIAKLNVKYLQHLYTTPHNQTTAFKLVPPSIHKANIVYSPKTQYSIINPIENFLLPNTIIIATFNKPYVPTHLIAKFDKSLKFYPQEALRYNNQTQKYFVKFLTLLKNTSGLTTAVVQETSHIPSKGTAKIIHRIL